MRNICIAMGLLAAGAAAAAPAPVIDNARVTVRDITLPQDGRGVTLIHDHDYVTLFLSGGGIRANGKMARRETGAAVFHHAGTETDVAVSGHPRLVVVDLKDAKIPPLANKTGYPLAFPRPGARKILDNDRVTVWNYAWQAGKPTPMHYHDKDVVVIYRGEGTLDSVTPEGQHTPTAHHVGEVRFNKGDRSHYELLTKGAQSAIMMELK